ncbi:hypothetical protein [Sphingomonas sp. ABOLF]|uniref:hypothetical protein n=2 Tax=Pseudomonadota TaxID=1224 RepID=UPI000F7E20A9|nr:hypothetical protein [Sphingomonas sp. ABOLF]
MSSGAARQPFIRAKFKLPKNNIGDARKMDRAEALGRELLSLARELSNVGYDWQDDMVAVEGRSMLPEPDWIQQASTLEGMTHALEEALEGMDLRPAPDAPPLAPDAVYTLGEWQQRAPLRQIVRGFVEPVRRVPLVSRVPEPVVLYLVHKLPGGAESLKREHHKGVGWHYHYLDKRKGRSNVVLCWDTRWEAAKTEEERKAQGPRPIFWEHHGEGNADFSAQPSLWGDPKRQSMREVCAGDLKRNISEFRPASDDAEPVWPLLSILTPRAVTPPPAAPAAPAGGGKKRR